MPIVPQHFAPHHILQLIYGIKIESENEWTQNGKQRSRQLGFIKSIVVAHCVVAYLPTNFCWTYSIVEGRLKMVLHRSIFMGIWVLVFVLIIDVGFDQDSTLSAMVSVCVCVFVPSILFSRCYCSIWRARLVRAICKHTNMNANNRFFLGEQTHQT